MEGGGGGVPEKSIFSLKIVTRFVGFVYEVKRKKIAVSNIFEGLFFPRREEKYNYNFFDLSK